MNRHITYKWYDNLEFYRQHFYFYMRVLRVLYRHGKCKTRIYREVLSKLKSAEENYNIIAI